jgi:hypothetical protein
MQPACDHDVPRWSGEIGRNEQNGMDQKSDGEVEGSAKRSPLNRQAARECIQTSQPRLDQIGLWNDRPNRIAEFLGWRVARSKFKIGEPEIVIPFKPFPRQFCILKARPLPSGILASCGLKHDRSLHVPRGELRRVARQSPYGTLAKRRAIRNSPRRRCLSQTRGRHSPRLYRFRISGRRIGKLNDLA